jgi:hypothetical protein
MDYQNEMKWPKTFCHLHCAGLPNATKSAPVMCMPNVHMHFILQSAPAFSTLLLYTIGVWSYALLLLASKQMHTATIHRVGSEK